MKDTEIVFGNPNYQGPFGNTLLHGAVISGDIQEVERLLAGGADPHIANLDGRTPADVAMILGHRSIRDLLMRYGPQGEIPALLRRPRVPRRYPAPTD
jgi:ankyrin repeat protein